MTADATTPSRRVFLQASAAAGGGLLLTGFVGFEGMPVGAPVEPGVRDVALNAWLRISTDDQVTLICSQSEMGQGIMTTLPAVLAEELGADWRRVKVEISPVATVYRNPRINWMFTGNSESTTGFFDLLLQMGASAREMLIAAAARRWRVEPRDCHAAGGQVRHRPTARALAFGDLVEAAAQQTPPEKPPLKAPKEWTLLGRSLPRVELPAKLNGTAIFGLDFRVPGMLYAVVKQSPCSGSGAFDSGRGTSRSRRHRPIPSGVAVVANLLGSPGARALPEFRRRANASLSMRASWPDTARPGRARGRFARRRLQERRSSDREPWTRRPRRRIQSQFLAHGRWSRWCTAHVTRTAADLGPQGPELAQSRRPR